MVFRYLRPGLVTCGLVLASLGAAAPAFAGGIPPTVGPNQFFTALVQGQSGRAQIVVTCRAGVGHPVAGQTVEVLPVAGTPDGNDGFTGTEGKRIDVFTSAGAAAPAVDFSVYETPKAIPVTATVPCGGVDVISFVPFASSATSRPARVKVTFVVQPTPFRTDAR